MEAFKDYFQSCVYAFDGKNSILEEKDLGICADIASMLTPEYSVAAMECQQGCPYTNTAFRFDLTVDGEQVKTDRWKWLPNAMLRRGETPRFAVETLTAVIPGTRTTVQKITLQNRTAQPLVMPLQIAYRGQPRWEANWKVAIPKAETGRREGYTAHDRLLHYSGNGADFCITCSLPGMRLFI